MTYNAKDELLDDVAAATVAALTITWTTGTPTASTAMTVADGAAVTSTETGVFMISTNAQVAALIVDVAAIRTAVNA